MRMNELSRCMHVPYVLTNLGKIKTSNGIYGGIHMFSINISVTSQATTFAISVPIEEFSFQPNPQLYICGNKNLVSKLQAKYFHIYIPTIYIYFCIKATHQ